MNFSDYIQRFELWVVEAGINKGILGKLESVSIRNGRLAVQPFGQAMGVKINANLPFAIDYYGHVKKSNGFFVQLSDLAVELKAQIKGIEVPVVHFASIKIEHVAELYTPLVTEFPLFKKEVLRLRGFQSGGPICLP